MSELALVLFGALFPLAAAYTLGRLLVRKPGLPRSVALAVGAAVLSHVIFLLLLAGGASRAAFATLGLACLLPVFWVRGTHYAETGTPVDPLTRRLTGIVLAAYGALYAVHALAPEIEPDGYTYHLGLVAEWLREGGFTERIGFYEMLPQGLEMLFAFAFAFGGHSAARLVHFGFLAATVPLLFSLSRQLRLPDGTAGAAAVFYACSPVVGISGTSSYSDAALVFFCLAVFYLLLVWQAKDDDRYLLPAGLAAGFCYSIKFTGIIVAPLALAFVLARRRWRGAALLAAAALLMIAPWMIRNTVLSGNPFAPLFNRFFPNPHFHIATEQALGKQLRSYGVPALDIPVEIALRGQKLQGLIGPLFLLAPVALLAVRRRAGRMLLSAALLLAIPWLFNTGARFLMPSLVFLALALAMSLPRPVATVCVLFHAVACWPQVLSVYARAGAWHLEGFPWRAALRLEAEQDYLRRTLWEYRVADLVKAHTKPGDRVLDLFALPTAYTGVVALHAWHSAEGDLLADALKTGATVDRGILYELRAEWPRQALEALRFRQTAAQPAQWSIHEVQLQDGDNPVRSRRGWRLAAWPNVWEGPLAFDRNLTSRWATWEPMRPGMHLDVELGRPQPLTGAWLVCHGAEDAARVEFHGRAPDGAWRLLSASPRKVIRPALNLRRSAIRLLERYGVSYIITPVGYEGYGLLGRTLVDNAGDWGLEILGNEDNVYLLKIR